MAHVKVTTTFIWPDIAGSLPLERARQGTTIRELMRHVSDTHGKAPHVHMCSTAVANQNIGQVPDPIRADFLKIIKRHLADEVQF